MTTETTEIGTDQNPETAVVGLDYTEGTHDGADGRCSIRLRFADWVMAGGRDKATLDRAGLNRRTGPWAGRLDDLSNILRRADFDGIAGIDPAGNRFGGGSLDRAGVVAALALIEERKRTAAPTAAPGPVECLSCGRAFPADQAHRVRSHGMGCDHCGH